MAFSATPSASVNISATCSAKTLAYLLIDTIASYDGPATAVVAATANVDLAEPDERFLAPVRPGGLTLDAACGSGRD